MTDTQQHHTHCHAFVLCMYSCSLTHRHAWAPCHCICHPPPLPHATPPPCPLFHRAPPPHHPQHPQELASQLAHHNTTHIVMPGPLLLSVSTPLPPPPPALPPQELVSQLAHHNTATRRDALTGLQQLVISHPAEARRHTALLLEALAPRLSDGEASVRTTLLTTLRCAVLPALGPASLSPFMPLLLAHVSAALTNLSADVRFDALAVLEAVTEAAPQLMAAQLGVGLAHYTGLLSRANRGKSIKSQALSGGCCGWVGGKHSGWGCGSAV
jgi:hypothetical protein